MTSAWPLPAAPERREPRVADVAKQTGKARAPHGAVPVPGRPVRGSRTGRPIMAALDLLGRRHVLRLVWELREGPVGFREMQSRCDGLSPSTLSQRLTDLRDAGLVTTDADGRNDLTATGRSLLTSLEPLLDWSHSWAEGRPPQS